MATTARDIMDLIQKEDIKMVDFKIVDINGQFRHVTIPACHFNEDTMVNGIGFDASNYGYAVVEKSDMVYIPDLETAAIDPFCDIKTLSMIGNAMIIDYPENRPLAQYPRNIVAAAEKYMKDSGIADTMLILPEFEFYLFDQAAWTVENNQVGFTVDAAQAHWNSATEGTGNVVPFQLLGDFKTMADGTMMVKYIIHNVARKYGFSATLMPKPVYNEAGSGMHVHMLLLKNDEPVFSDDNGYSHLSKEAHWFMGGLLKHIASLCAITNPSTNSFKRLVPGFEAPVTIGYATSNRSAVIRIPAYAKSPKMRRFELRNPDATCNPYFCYAAILMAGLDGIKNQIDPHANGWGPYDMNLFDLSEEEKKKLHQLPTTLEQALDALEEDHDYLTAGGVFPEELIANFLKNKRAECSEISRIPHPVEFEKYYNL